MHSHRFGNIEMFPPLHRNSLTHPIAFGARFSHLGNRFPQEFDLLLHAATPLITIRLGK